MMNPVKWWLLEEVMARKLLAARIWAVFGKWSLFLFLSYLQMCNLFFLFEFWNQYEALAWLCGGLGFFASLGLLAVCNDKASKIPFVSPKFFTECFTFLLDHEFLYWHWCIGFFQALNFSCRVYVWIVYC